MLPNASVNCLLGVTHFYCMEIDVRQLVVAISLSLFAFGAAHAEQIGDANAALRWLGKDDRIAVEAYDDRKVLGVACYVSRARTGGVKGTVGLAKDKTEASIACRRVSDSIQFAGRLPIQEDVFTERMSILFKRVHIVRVVGPKRNALVYLTYSDKLIDEPQKQCHCGQGKNPSSQPGGRAEARP
jgi:CreA protein